MPYVDRDAAEEGTAVKTCPACGGEVREQWVACPACAARLDEQRGVGTTVIDLRSVQPLDRRAVCDSVRATGRLLVVDEDYKEFGLSGELAATVMEEGLAPAFGRVCVEGTIPFDPRRELAVLPNVDRIVAEADALLSG